ncbi:cell wall-binding repeat-containing protein [Planctomonas psychrotolerans]|uniref:cell wall-binding repeat-containing protein n=1 Tax=Planctomonas psychrotolerans TaxID=2528712 RepID=UPI001238DBD9|nr:cell wall-binding repeat-containing protein [Planctomonas psychrotolerans]
MRADGFRITGRTLVRRTAVLALAASLVAPISTGAVPASATGSDAAMIGTDDSTGTGTELRIEGMLLRLSGQDAHAGEHEDVHAGEHHTDLLPDRVQVLTADGAAVDVTGPLVDDAETGSTFSGSVGIPQEAEPDIVAELDVRRMPLSSIDGGSALGKDILSASAALDVPLPVVSGTVSPGATGPSRAVPSTPDAGTDPDAAFDVDAVVPATAHSLAFAVVSLPSRPTEIIVSDADLAEKARRLSTYWTGQSGGQVAGMSQVGPVDRFTSASACDADTVWSEASARMGVSKASWVQSPSKHLVVIVPSSCGGGSGYGSVGSTLTGGLVWVSFSAPVAELTLAHELGHNLSLRHSNSVECGVGMTEGVSCADSEYRDFYDVMGGGLTVNGDGSPNLMALNVTHRSAIAALNASDLASVRLPAGAGTAATSHVLSPSSAPSGVRGLRISDPSTGEQYFVEYRSGTGIDAGSIYARSVFPGHAPGVRVLTLRSDKSSAVFTVPAANGTTRNSYLAVGQSFTSKSGRVRIDVTAVGSSATVGVTLGAAVSATDPGPAVLRLGGTDRFDTAVRVSSRHAPGVPVAYVASGAAYPDALSAAPAAAAGGGPLLLTLPGELPASVLAELRRLRPAAIVVVGGTASVSDAVYSQLTTLAPTTTRVWGADRYATSRAVIEHAFGASRVGRVYLATGRNFPDALSASAAAGAQSGAVLLVDGAADTLDAESTALLRRVTPVDVALAGGTHVLSAGIERDAMRLGFSGGVRRMAGTDRFGTTRMVNADVGFAFSSADSVYLANGYSFPDALAGAALAGQRKAPLFIVPGACVPAGIRGDILDFDPDTLVLLGGRVSLTTAVESLTPCA